MTSRSLGGSRVWSLAAPIANERERAEFQARLSLISLSTFALAGSYWVIITLWHLALSPASVHEMWSLPSTQLQIATTLFGLAVALLTRGRPRSARMLGALDVVATLFTCFG